MSTLYELVVVVPFGNYQRGNVITDPVVISSIVSVDGELHSNFSNVRQTSRILQELKIVNEPAPIADKALNLKEKKQ
jgi:hypothetical protein